MAKLTVFNNIPLDMIKSKVFPSLNYEDRINLNICLPPKDRISRKMSKASIEKHERTILIMTIGKYLDTNKNSLLNIEKQLQNMIKLFRMLQKPRYFALIAMYPKFRDSVKNKIRNLIGQLLTLTVPVELGIRLKLASELKKLRNKIDTSGPYTSNTIENAPLLSFQ